MVLLRLSASAEDGLPTGSAKQQLAGAGSVLLLFDRELGGREGLEALVGNRLAALHGEAVCAGREARLGPLDRRQARFQVLTAAGVELVLVETLGVHVARFDSGVSLLGAFALERGKLLLDLLSLAGKQLLGALRIHVNTVARRWVDGAGGSRMDGLLLSNPGKMWRWGSTSTTSRPTSCPRRPGPSPASVHR